MRCNILENKIKELESNKNRRVSKDESNDKCKELERKIDELIEQNQRLQNDNQELVTNLNQLDQDCQQTTDKLISLRDTLQVDLNRIREDYDQMVQKNKDLEGRIVFYEKENKDLIESFKMLNNRAALQVEDNKEAYNSVCSKNFDLEKEMELCEIKVNDLEEQKIKLEDELTKMVKGKYSLSPKIEKKEDTPH